MPVLFSWEDALGVHQRAEGSTRDISGKGAFILCGEYPPAGVSIHLEISLPPAPQAVRPLQIRADALVLRVEREGSPPDTCGFAVINKKISFLAGGEES